MINHQLKCIFVEIPKTASTSVRSIVGAPQKPHLNIYQICQSLPADQFQAYFKFSFVRNPWDRVVSLYERNEGLQLKNKMTFEEFVDWIQFSSATCLHPVPHRYQLDWLVDTNGRVMVNAIGRYESIEDDWAKIAAKLSVSPTLPRLNENRSKKRHYTEYYTDKTRDIIRRKFSVDIEAFQYDFTP